MMPKMYVHFSYDHRNDPIWLQLHTKKVCTSFVCAESVYTFSVCIRKMYILFSYIRKMYILFSYAYVKCMY